MNTQHTGGPASLPDLSAERIDEIEQALFDDIARERSARTARSARRGRIWMAGGAAAAIVAIAAIIAPAVVPMVSGGATDEAAVAPAGPAVAPESGGDSSVTMTDDAVGGEGSRLLEGTTLPAEESAAPDRDIISSASATVAVEDVEVAARTIGNSAVAQGGYVESMSIGTSGVVYPVDPMSGVAYDSMPYPYTPDGAWITVRVPADQLPVIIAELPDVGEVTASSVNRQDVTAQTVDLEARIDAAEASVDRLVELMGQAESVADLIAAEAALAERQALLESYQQQLEMLEDQVAMSSLSVTLTPVVEPVTADPAGFADGLAAGWNGLVATLNGIVIALGFLLPWLLVVGVAGLVVWGIVRLVRRRRAARVDAAAPPAASADSTVD